MIFVFAPQQRLSMMLTVTAVVDVVFIFTPTSTEMRRRNTITKYIRSENFSQCLENEEAY